jgi:hypothetical protein
MLATVVMLLPITMSVIDLVRLELPGGRQLLGGLRDASIAIAGASILFALPVDLKRGVLVLTWHQTRKLP